MILTNGDKQCIEATVSGIVATETRLLTAFPQWASPLETKVRSYGHAIQALDQEHENYLEVTRKLNDLDHRLSRLEKAS